MKKIVLAMMWASRFLFPVAYAQEPDACQDMTKLELPGDKLEILKAESLLASSTSPPTAKVGPPRYSGPLPAYCRIDGVIDSRIGVDGKPYGIGFAIALPDNWNGRFLFQGGGGLNGTIQTPLGAQAAGNSPALARGFAVVSTDTGHKGAGAFSAEFLKDQQANLDFSYIAIGRVAEAAKQIIARYYGRQADHSYYVGCSTGGREGMIMSQRYPMYFDGIVAGDPAMRTGFSNLALRWIAVAFNRITPKDAAGNLSQEGAFSDSDRKLVVDAILKRCDAKDGLADKIIFDARGCDFDPATLRCDGAKSESCLSDLQVDAIKRAFAGPKDSRGFQVYPGFPYDTGIASKGRLPGLLVSVRIPVGPPGKSTDQDVDRESLVAHNPLSDSTFTNLSTFAGRGSKLIFYHGLSDPWFSPLDTLEYYEKMSGENGGLDSVRDWSRLFLVPGMGHCGEGDQALDSFDFLSAVVEWVEKGTPPDFVLASGRAFPDRTRPLCPYPQFAHYKGQGDPERADNFECR